MIFNSFCWCDRFVFWGLVNGFYRSRFFGIIKYRGFNWRFFFRRDIVRVYFFDIRDFVIGRYFFLCWYFSCDRVCSRFFFFFWGRFWRFLLLRCYFGWYRLSSRVIFFYSYFWLCRRYIRILCFWGLWFGKWWFIRYWGSYLFDRLVYFIDCSSGCWYFLFLYCFFGRNWLLWWIYLFFLCIENLMLKIIILVNFYCKKYLVDLN